MLPHATYDNSDHRSAHRMKMTAEKALRADPVASTAKLQALNAPVLQRRQMPSVAAVASGLATKQDREPAGCVQAAARIILPAEASAMFRAAQKRAGGKSYQPNGSREWPAARGRLNRAGFAGGTIARLGVVTLSGLIRLEVRQVVAGVRHETVAAYATHHAARHRKMLRPQSCGSP